MVEEKDQMALAAIVQVVPKTVVMAISEKEMTKEAWDALKEMHVGEDCIRNACLQTLKRERESLRVCMYMGELETIDKYALKLTTTVNEIRSLGTKVEESTIMEKLLHSTPDKFLHIVSTIEQWGDVIKMLVMEAVGRLRTYEESLKGRRRDKEGEHLLLSRAEWEAKAAKEEQLTLQQW